MARFKVGDTVRIRKDVPEGFNKRDVNFVSEEMAKEYGGKIAKVIAHEDFAGYRLDIDSDSDFPWTWFNRCLEQYIDWDDFEAGRVEVYCPTKKSFERFLKAAKKRGLHWRSGASATAKRNEYFVNESGICVSCAYGVEKMGYHDLGWKPSTGVIPLEVITWR